MARIAVIGAGPAGLSAATQAAEAGHDVVVLEAASTVGGMSGSFVVSGVRVDYGSHRLHASTSPAFMARLVDLLGDDLQTRERNGRIRLRDRWVAFPLRLADMARHLPPDFVARVGVESVSGALRRRSRGPGSSGFLDDLERRLGPTVTREFYEPYAKKLYGTDPWLLGSELARRRVSAASPMAVIAKALRAQRRDGRIFYYPRRGYGQVSEALADAAVKAGADMRLGQRVVSIRSGVSPVVETETESVAVDLVFSTMPVPALIEALGAGVPPEIGEAAAALTTQSMVLVYLVLPRSQYTSFDAHYFPSADLAMSRLSEPKNYRDGDDPDDRTVLCAELPCRRGDQIWNASDQELAALVARDLARADLPAVDGGHKSGAAGAEMEVEVRRLPSVYPVYEQATEPARAQLERWLASIPNVLSFGRQGLDVPDNLHHVLDMGYSASDAIDDVTGGVNADQWQRSLQRFRSHVVVD